MNDTIPSEWIDPNNPALIVYGHRRRNTLLELHRRGEVITAEHLAAAEIYAIDYEVGIHGASPGRESKKLDRVDESSGGSSGVSSGRLVALRQLRSANKAVGKRLCPILFEVVVNNVTVKMLADRYRLNNQVVVGRLSAVMDLLSEHYEYIGRI